MNSEYQILIVLNSDLIFNKYSVTSANNLKLNISLANKLKKVIDISLSDQDSKVLLCVNGYKTNKSEIDKYFNQENIQIRDELTFQEFYKHYKACKLFYTDIPKILLKKSKFKCINYISKESKVIMQESFKNYLD
jgi:hypothetical protein